MKQAIYETKGKAREFCELAINLYSGCGHGCAYCYVPDVIHKDRQEFVNNPHPRVDRWTIERSANDWAAKGEKRPVLLCFATDCYQPIEEELKLTRLTLEILKHYELHFTVLTKAGLLAQRDFDLYGEGDSFGATLTCLNSGISKVWEPNAGLPHERMANLKAARDRGIPTWVSLEPVIDPDTSLDIIDKTAEFVDHWKLGKMNYHPHAETIDWKQYARMALDKLHKLNKGFYMKRDLANYLGYTAVKEGRQLP